MVVCVECGAQRPPDAGWCGSCGANLREDVAAVPSRTTGAVDHGSGTSPTETDGELPSSRRDAVDAATSLGAVDGGTPGRDEREGGLPPVGRRRWTTIVAAAILVLAVVAVVTGLEDEATTAVPDPPTTAPSNGLPDPGLGTDVPGDAQLTGAGGLDVRWIRSGVLASTDASPVRVVRAGPDHVVVEGRVVRTSGDAPVPIVTTLPVGAVAGLDSEAGTWAVAEAGAVVIADVGAAAPPAFEVTGDWVPNGPSIAWVDGEPVFAGTDGRHGRVDRSGEVRWTTSAPIGLTGRRPGALLGVADPGEDGGGLEVVLDLDDGEVRPLANPNPVVAVAGGTTVRVGPEDTVSATGATTWERVVPGASTGEWTVTVDGLVLVSTDQDRLLGFAGDGARLYDPGTGELLATVAATSPAPIAGGVVTIEDREATDDAGPVVLRRWDGTVSWRQAFDERQNRSVSRIDDGRVAVELLAAGGLTLVKVVDVRGGTVTTTGLSLTERTTAPIVTLGPDGIIGVSSDELSQVGGLGWVDITSGRDAVAAATVAIEGFDRDDGWRFAGTVQRDDRERVVVTRRDRDRLLVRVGEQRPIVTQSSVPEPVDPPRVLSGGTHVVVGEGGDGPVALVSLADGQVVDAVGAGAVAQVADVVVGRDPATGELVATRLVDGVEAWRLPALAATDPFPRRTGALVGVPFAAAPLVVEAGTVTLRARTADTGTQVWSVQLPAPLVAAPVLVGERLVAPLGDETLMWVQQDDGAIVERTQVGMVSTSVTTGDVVVVGTAAGAVVLVDGEGQMRGARDIGTGDVVDVVVGGNNVIVAAVDGGLIGLVPSG